MPRAAPVTSATLPLKRCTKYALSPWRFADRQLDGGFAKGGFACGSKVLCFICI
jgi:hypothetical protein